MRRTDASRCSSSPKHSARDEINPNCSSVANTSRWRFSVRSKKFARQLVSDAPDGRIKMFLIAQTLRARRNQSELFERGEYLPLEVLGQIEEIREAIGERCAGRTHQDVPHRPNTPRETKSIRIVRAWRIPPAGGSR